MKFFLPLFASFTLILAGENKIDTAEDVFDLNLYDLQQLKVSSISKLIQKFNFSPSKIIVVSKEQIDDRGYQGLDELLNDLPGIQVMRHADSGIVNQVGIRGMMGNKYFKILQDGIEIDKTSKDVLNNSIEYPLFGIERVEVLYGTASIAYGADAFSGVINLVSVKAPDDELGIAWGRDGYTYGYGLKSIPLSDGLLTLRAYYQNDQDYELDKEYPNDFIRSAQNSEFNFQPHISKAINVRYEKGGLEMGVNYRYSSDSTLISMNNENSITNIFDSNANLNTESKSVYGRYIAHISDTIQSTTTLNYDVTELLSDSYFINQYTGYKPAYNYAESERYALEETLATSIGNHNLLLGLSHEWCTSTPMTIGQPFSDLSSIVYYPGSNDTIEAPIFNLKWNNSALYLQDQIALNENFEFSVAGRYDKNSEYGSTFNPRFALIHATENLTHKLIYSQATLPPLSYEKYKIYGSPLQTNTLSDGNAYQSDRFRVVNPDLKPEKNKSIEYDLDWFMSQNDQLSVSLYYSTIKEMISNEELLPNQANFIPNTTIIETVGAINRDKTVLYGGDIGYQGRSYFADYDISYWLNYSYIDGKIKDQYDSPIPYVSEHVLKSGGTLCYGDWRFSPSLIWTSPIRSATYDNGVSSTLNGHFIMNLFGSYHVDKNKKISLKVDNLFDEHYYGVRYNSSSNYQSPQDTRMFSIAFSMSI